MGILRFESKRKEPGFTKLSLTNPMGTGAAESSESFKATIRLVSRHGTVVQLSRDVPLKQVARLVRMLDGSLQL